MNYSYPQVAGGQNSPTNWYGFFNLSFGSVEQVHPLVGAFILLQL